MCLSKLISKSALIFFLILSPPLFSKDKKEEAARDKVLKSLCQYENVSLAKHINPYFLSKLSEKKLIGILDSFKKEEGPCVSIEKIDKSNYLYNTGKSQRAMQLYLDEKSRIRGLWFGNTTNYSDQISEVILQLKNLPGEKSIVFIKNNKHQLLGLNEKKRLSVAGSSDLLLIKLLKEKISKTKSKWSHKLNLKNKLKSIPGGQLYSWPEGSPVTLQTLATMLMGYSDETAFDHIHSFLSRSKIEKETKVNRPFLSTTEYYKIKLEGEEKYLKLSLKEKYKHLEKMRTKKLKPHKKNPKHSKIGWFFSTTELCQLMNELKGLPITEVNKGFSQFDRYSYSSFKMGRAPGVLQYTQFFTSKISKDSFCLSVTWNNPNGEVTPSKIDALFGRVLSKFQ
ncbi:MAG: hypothetical protein ACJAT2_002482 [Bacteriovoracaceae bacterium]|jgi:hypothetical protein